VPSFNLGTLAGVLYLGVIVLWLFYLLLPLLIYRRCGRILQRLEQLERFLGTEEH
jgi:hypothetical protein